MELIRIDTLSRIRAACYGLFGWRLDCSARYWDYHQCNARSASFDIDVDKLVAERGEDHPWSHRMPPVTCPRCGSRRVEVRVDTPDRRDAKLVRPERPEKPKRIAKAKSEPKTDSQR